jgi:NAD(P)-dependent dehydrogenase (short-subunit alcohol dehydrogenase family)
MAKMPTPMGRAAEVIEVVDLILYLCSDKASYISGTVISIDGARSCGGNAG